MAGTPSSSVGSSSGGAIAQIYDNVASGAIASWDVNAIAQTYNHLKVVITARGSVVAASAGCNARFNNDSGANYDSQRTYSNNAGVAGSPTYGATSLALPTIPAASSPANAAGTIEILIPNYTGTTFYKGVTFLGFGVQAAYGANDYAWSGGGDWFSTAAITRITILPSSANFVAGSRLTIYGMT